MHKKPSSYYELNMGLIKTYSKIIPKADLEKWKNEGWIEDSSFSDFHYAPGKSETVVLGKPQTLSEAGTSDLVGKEILGFMTHLGSYGMGGPGFFGLKMERSGSIDYLTYAVWASGEYIMMDNRVLECHLRYNDTYRPWISSWAGEGDEQQWDELTDVVVGSMITHVSLSHTVFVLHLAKDEQNHRMVFYRNHDALPPLGSGTPRDNAFTEGTIGEYLVFNREHAVLHVR